MRKYMGKYLVHCKMQYKSNYHHCQIITHSPLPLLGSLVYLAQCEGFHGTNYKLQNKLLQVHRQCFSPLLNSVCIHFLIFASCCFISSTYLVAKKKEILQAPHIHWNEISLRNLWGLQPNLILSPDLVPMTSYTHLFSDAIRPGESHRMVTRHQVLLLSDLECPEFSSSLFPVLSSKQRRSPCDSPFSASTSTTHTAHCPGDTFDFHPSQD